MPETKKTIRNLDDKTFLRARTAALRAGVSLGQWATEAFKEKLNNKRGKNEKLD